MLTVTTLGADVMQDVIQGVMQDVMQQDRRRWLGSALRELWRTSPPLTAVGLALLVVCAASLAGLALDPRVITGAPAWLKPAKFAASTAIYALTLAWVLGYVANCSRFVAVVGWVAGVVVALEVRLIDFQPARGTTSHFNVGPPLDAAIFATMGIAIL